MAIASLRDIVVTAGTFPLLAGVNLELEGATSYVVTGPNGVGKTSLLRLLAGLEAPTRGSGHVLNFDLATTQRRQVRRNVGWLGHEGSFYDDLSATDNLLFAARALRLDVALVAPALERVGLGGRLRTPVKLLSAGQRRRLGLAWLLVRRPQLWLLDEPYASLDDAGRELMSDLINHATASGATVVLSSHDPVRSDVVASHIEMRGGRIERVG